MKGIFLVGLRFNNFTYIFMYVFIMFQKFKVNLLNIKIIYGFQFSIVVFKYVFLFVFLEMVEEFLNVFLERIKLM